VPVAFVPAGNTSVPSTVTGSAKDAAKRSPVLLVFVLTLWSIVTVSTVPAAIATGGRGAGALRASFFDASEPEVADSGDVLEELHPHNASKTPAASQRLIT
jgi:hypothetical protein